MKGKSMSKCRLSTSISVQMDIVANILSRLHVKPLLRFKCVSKAWHDLITSSSFIKLHLEHWLNQTQGHNNNSNNNSLQILFSSEERVSRVDWYDNNRSNYSTRYTTNCYTLDLSPVLDMNYGDNSDGHGSGQEHKEKQIGNLGVNLERLLSPELDDGNSILVPVGSCNGLVCLRDKPGCRFCLFNPSTRSEYLKLPPIRDDREDAKRIMHIDLEARYGFGYDAIEDDYKVVKIEQGKEKQSYVRSKIMVYSWRNKGWKEYNQDMKMIFPHYPVDDYHLYNGAYSDNNLYWIANQMPRENENMNKVVIRFDLHTEKFDKITTPLPAFKSDFRSSTFLVCLRGSLHFVLKGSSSEYQAKANNNTPFDFVDVWVMKEYGAKKSWRILGRVKLKCLGFEKPIFSFTERGHDMIILQNSMNGHLLWGDLSTGQERATGQLLPVRSGVNPRHCQPYVASLVALDECSIRTQTGTKKCRDNSETGQHSELSKKRKEEEKEMLAEVKRLQAREVEMQTEIERLKADVQRKEQEALEREAKREKEALERDVKLRADMQAKFDYFTRMYRLQASLD